MRGAEQIDGFIAMTHAGPADDPDQYLGFDVIVTDDGRIRSVYGFMDAAPRS